MANEQNQSIFVLCALSDCWHKKRAMQLSTALISLSDLTRITRKQVDFVTNLQFIKIIIK